MDVVWLIGVAFALAAISLGGGFYETIVVDPVWPSRPDIVRPAQGGINRKRFWIPAHVLFELTLIAALYLSWGHETARTWLLAAVVTHGVMRLWSAVYFIPKALAFERAEPASTTEATARIWTRRSRLRLPLDIATCFSILGALIAAARLG